MKKESSRQTLDRETFEFLELILELRGVMKSLRIGSTIYEALIVDEKEW